MSIVGTIVDHHLFSQKERAKRLNRSRTLWTSEYPHQPFDQDPGCPEDPRASAPSKLTYDIIAAAERQSVFFYQVSLPHFRDRKFLNAAEARYRKFLWLKQQNPRLFIVPCYDIDLIWHTHQLHPVGYKKDMEAVLGHTFNHDDSVTDRSEGSKLYNSDMETRELWRNTFGENFALYAVFRFELIELRNMPKLNGKLKLKVYTSANNKVKSPVANLTGGPLWQQKNVAEVNFHTRDVNCLKFRVMEQTGFACFGSKTVIADNEINMLPVINSLTQASVLEKSLPMGQNNQPVVNFKAHVSQPKRGPILLIMQQSSFTRAVMPENVESMWGPVPLRPLSPGVQNTCDVASHNRVIHSLPLMQSAVHIFYQDKMAAVAHLVVDPKKAVYLNPVAGERGVLIKNHAGDWGFVVGRWSGMKKGPWTARLVTGSEESGGPARERTLGSPTLVVTLEVVMVVVVMVVVVMGVPAVGDVEVAVAVAGVVVVVVVVLAVVEVEDVEEAAVGEGETVADVDNFGEKIQ
nr:hypothetical protein BaRGS_029342 [Batillaria attramentaria]